MYLRRYFFYCKILAVLLASIGKLGAENTLDDRRVKVAIRMVGHEILLRAGDSLSRVLPIEREGDMYILPFNTAFQFDPDELVILIDSLFTLSNVNQNYLVEVKECDTKKVVYSFEIYQDDDQDLVPCKNRTQPKACYVLYFSFFDKKNQAFLYLDTFDYQDYKTDKEKANQKLSGYYLLILFSLVAGGVVYYKNKTKLSAVNPNHIRIGIFLFDKTLMSLFYQNETIELSSKESDLLSLLYASANQIVDRDILLHKVWGDEGDYVGRTLDVFISKLRKKLEADDQIKIINIRGVGYKLIV